MVDTDNQILPSYLRQLFTGERGTFCLLILNQVKAKRQAAYLMRFRGNTGNLEV